APRPQGPDSEGRRGHRPRPLDEMLLLAGGCLQGCLGHERRHGQVTTVPRTTSGQRGMLLPVDSRRWLLGGCVLVSLLLAACGGGGGSKTTTGSAAHQQTNANNSKAAAPKTVRLDVEVNGDLLIHSPVWEQALVDGHGHYDFYPMLREIVPYIRHADLAIC